MDVVIAYLMITLFMFGLVATLSIPSMLEKFPNRDLFFEKNEKYIFRVEKYFGIGFQKYKYINIEFKFINNKNRFFSYFSIGKRRSLDTSSFMNFPSKTLGDKNFDKKISLNEIYNDTIAPLLNAKLRKYLLELYDDSVFFQINHSKFIIKCKIKKNDADERIKKQITFCKKIADEITRIEDPVKSLIENIKSEKDINVKKFYFNSLMSNLNNFKRDDDVKKLLNSMKKSSVIEDRILSAPYLEEEGILILLKILQDNDLEKEAVCEILKLLGKQKIDDEYFVLPQLCKKYNNDEVIDAVIDTINVLELSQYENYILEYIENNNNNNDVRRNCIEAIGKFGTARSVEFLHKLMDETINPIQKRKYSQAIAQIQSRLGNVEKGWISVTDDEKLEGALSENDSPKKGSLSEEE